VDCKTCPANTFITDDGSVEENHLNIDGCIACEEGSFAIAGKRFCKTCSAGKQNVNGTCNGCSAGQFSTSETNLTCVNCGTGQYQTKEGKPYW